MNDDMREVKYDAAVEALTLFAVWREGTQWVNDMRKLEDAKQILKKHFGLE